MPRQDDHGQADAGLLQLLLHFQAAHVRHADVEQHASGIDPRDRIDKGGGTAPAAHGIALRLQHEGGGSADFLLVIDEVNQLILHAHTPLYGTR